jgi:hypothetical protein
LGLSKQGGQELSSMDNAIIVQKTIEAVEKSISESLIVPIV